MELDNAKNGLDSAKRKQAGSDDHLEIYDINILIARAKKEVGLWRK